jgi:Transposase DDE domain group 1
MITLHQTNDTINAQGGLALIGKLIAKLCPLERLFAPAVKLAGSAKSRKVRSDKLSDVDLIKTQIGLYSMGRSQYEDIESFRDIAPAESGVPGKRRLESFAQCLGTALVPSESTLRTGLKSLADAEGTSLAKLGECSLNILKHQPIASHQHGGWRFVPCDVDVACFDNDGSHREHLGRTYHGYDGFAPIFAYIGAQGYLLDHELRPGTQHCQNGTPEFLTHMLARLAQLKLKDEVLIRMDSGNDSADTLTVLRESGHRFIVKRNARREDPVKWLSLAMATGAPRESPRAGKDVWQGTCGHLSPGGESSTQEPLPVIYRVTRRRIDKKGQALLVDEIEVETYWTNLWHGAADIIELYHAHGTSEQFHSELKSDLNLERFPSGSYAVNRLMLQLGAVAYNLMRSIEEIAREFREQWPPRIKAVERRRVGSVIKDLILVAAKLVKHAGKEVLKLARGWSWTGVILAIDRRIEAMPSQS